MRRAALRLSGGVPHSTKNAQLSDSKCAGGRSHCVTTSKQFLLCFIGLDFTSKLSTQPFHSSIELQELRLDNARALLDHGMLAALPSRDELPLAYLQGVIDGLCDLSLEDPLTGLGNSRHFRAVQERTIDGVARSGVLAGRLSEDPRRLVGRTGESFHLSRR